MARELASAFEVGYTDPAGELAADDAPNPAVYQASIADPSACDRIALREVRGIDPGRADAAADAGQAGTVRACGACRSPWTSPTT